MVTQARLDIQPVIYPSGSSASVEVSVPVIDANLNCDGLILPIKPLLEPLVANKKQEWEQQLEQYILNMFKQVELLCLTSRSPRDTS